MEKRKVEDRVYNPQRVSLEDVTRKCGIYQIQNKLNKHFYIGSAINIRKRLRSHLNRLQKHKHDNIHLQHAFNLYGIDVFEFYVVEFCTPEVRLKSEQYWIDRFFGKPFFYNINPKADQPPIHFGPRILSEESHRNIILANSKKVVCLETGEEFESITKAAKQLNVSKVTLSKVCKGKRYTCGKLHFRYKEDYLKLTEEDIYNIIHTKPDLPRAKRCVCVETGVVYRSVSAASSAYGLSHSLVGLVCDGVRHSAAGHRWMYEEDYNRLTAEELKTILNTPIYDSKKACVCLETGVVYESISEAARQTGLNLHSMEAVCNGRLKSLGGLHFKLKEYYDTLTEQEIQEIITYKKHIKKCFCIDNNTLYATVTEASKALGIPRNFIVAVCNGSRNHTYGLHFKYVD